MYHPSLYKLLKEGQILQANFPHIEKQTCPLVTNQLNSPNILPNTTESWGDSG